MKCYQYPTPASGLIGERVYVYRNLHQDCWSVRSKKTGRVLAHCINLSVKDATFKVSEAGRQRVLREKRKNVHAGVEGVVCEDHGPVGRPVTYNPYKAPTFVWKRDGAPIHTSDRAVFVRSAVYA